MSIDECPHCGAPLRPNAVACRECGSDIETGWSDDIDYHSVELPEEPLPSGRSANFRTVAIICVVLMLGGAGALFSLGRKEVAGTILILALLLPVALMKLPGESDDDRDEPPVPKSDRYGPR